MASQSIFTQLDLMMNMNKSYVSLRERRQDQASYKFPQKKCHGANDIKLSFPPSNNGDGCKASSSRIQARSAAGCLGSYQSSVALSFSSIRSATFIR